MNANPYYNLVGNCNPKQHVIRKMLIDLAMLRRKISL